MSETSEAYQALYGQIEEAGSIAREVHHDAPKVSAPSERLALARVARDTARWFSYVAETLELQSPL